MRCSIQRLLLVSASLLLAACSGAVRWEEPAPGGVPSPASRSSQPDADTRPQWHTVLAGETLYAIAFRYALSANLLAAWNNLGDGTLIRVGQRLRLTPPGSAESPARPV